MIIFFKKKEQIIIRLSKSQYKMLYKIKKYISDKKISDFPLESKLDISSILNVQALLFINQNTRIFNLFNKR